MSRPKPFICQIVLNLPAICCGAYGDSKGRRCEEILPHTRHRVGEHTILHELLGNGYSCYAIEQELKRREALGNAV